MAHSVTFAEEDISAIFDEVHALAEMNHAETTPQSGAIKLDVKRAAYCGLAQSGMLATFTVRDGGELVGYSTWMLSQNLHYDGNWGSCLTTWLHPLYRRGMTAMRFQKFIDEHLIGRGCDRLMSESNDKFPGMGLVLQRRGYKPATHSYIRVV